MAKGKISLEEALRKISNSNNKWDFLFVYGTLKRGEPNHHYMKQAYFIGEAYTKEKYYRTGFISVYKNPIESAEGKQIEGELYLVPKKDLLGPIDRLEYHPIAYTRERIVVILKDTYKEVKAWMYFRNI